MWQGLVLVCTRLPAEPGHKDAVRQGQEEGQVYQQPEDHACHRIPPFKVFARYRLYAQIDVAGCIAKGHSMPTITLINGMERFNAHVWREVDSLLTQSGVSVTLHRFHDGHVAERAEALSRAIAQADVVFISLINDRDQADWLADQLKRSQTKTVFAYESMPEVMSLTRVGDYRIDGTQAKSMPKPMQALLRLITKGRDEDTLYAYTKLTKAASKLLPLMPAKLKDFRTWLSVNIYWNQPDAANLAQMIRLILRDCVGVRITVEAPRMIPQMGCFHPDSEQLFESHTEYLRWATKTRRYRRGQPLVALLVFRKHLLQQQTYPADLIRALEAKDLAVLPIFVSGIEAHVAIREWVAKERVDFLISTMGFAVVGGPAGSTRPGAHRDTSAAILSALDVPYMIAQPLQMQSVADWHAHGIAPMQAVIMYDLPEMDGSVAPVVIGAIEDQKIVTVPDRVERVATIAARWVRLRRKPANERRVALVLYNYPPGLGRLGTAALLNVPATLHALMQRMQTDGYAVANIPETVTDLAKRIAAMEGGQGDHIAVAVRQLYDIVPDDVMRRVDAKWGSAPGDIAPLGSDGIRLDAINFGNVLVGVQPPLGVPGDPMRMLFDRDYAPHHQYVAFYRYLIDIWQADAIVHVGMHGTVEWLPGQQLGMTATCWPDIVVGDIPQLYIYPLNNPAESAIAKRRGSAAIISHLIPPYARAGLYKQLAQLRNELERGANPQTIAGMIPELPMNSGETANAYITRVARYLDDLEQRLILDGLHVLGARVSRERSVALVEAALDVPRMGQPGLLQTILASGIDVGSAPTVRSDFVQQVVIDRVSANAFWQNYFRATPPAHVDEMIAHGREMLVRLEESGDEIDVVMHGLEGRYILPGHGADPIRSGAAALPSGRNIHGIDPWRLPSDSALARGQQMAEQLVQQHMQAHGEPPKTVALTLWALDTIKSEGESIGVLLGLIGAQPARDGQGKIYRYDLIPLNKLGRARVDVVLDISSIFRDNFQMILDLIDDVVVRAARSGEPEHLNPIVAHVTAMQRAGQSFEQATARIFTQPPGEYGTGVDMVVDESQWDQRSDLASVYVQRSGYAYGGQRAGTAAHATYRSMLGTVDHVFQAIDSVEYGLTDMQHYYGHSGAVQLAASYESGRSVDLSYAETFTGRTTITSAKQMISMEARTKILNPRWYEPLLTQGYAGATEIANRFTNVMGWSAVGESVENWVYDGMAQTFLLDEDVHRRLVEANPHAAKAAVQRLLEANGRGLWQSDDATIAQLQQMYADIEDRLEGVAS